MKKYSVVILAFVLVLLMLCSAVQAEDAATYKVTYHENNCLASVPTDEKVYKEGDTVTTLFEPVTYKDYLTFYGWSFTENGQAQFGYSYNTFTMPANDINLYAICISGNSYSKPAPRPDYTWFPPEIDYNHVYYPVQPYYPYNPYNPYYYTYKPQPVYPPMW